MGECGWVDIFYWWIGVVGGIFLAGGDGWTFFIGGRGCLGLGEGIYWVNGGGWTFFMGG